jgi:hypothetical protein
MDPSLKLRIAFLENMPTTTITFFEFSFATKMACQSDLILESPTSEFTTADSRTFF